MEGFLFFGLAMFATPFAIAAGLLIAQVLSSPSGRTRGGRLLVVASVVMMVLLVVTAYFYIDGIGGTG